MLTCFDPEVCAMLQLKQNKYPVLQLGIAPEYMDTRLEDCSTLMYSAVSNGLLGVCLDSRYLLAHPAYLKLAHSLGLVLLLWGDAANDPDVRHRLIDMGVDGLIFDR
ncbi:unnamed protein product [Protopolystoma xenopodis]|uniref:GP-PDE domain-containing protein n=1 Tax=Protopolystoma xenopodis TaxID=117903 RepID=A0A3S5FGD7_9PLAT|nr:unnamed protein product [Protopolystoma xenopodis]